MPYQQMPTFSATQSKMFELGQPGVGGLDLNDLEYEQTATQSPFMINMMYRNGSFSKRYGQKKYLSSDFTDDILAIEYFNQCLFIHTGTKLIKIDGTTQTEISSSLPSTAGKFVKFYNTLYYWHSSNIYSYKRDDDLTSPTYGQWSWGVITPLVPTVLINCMPAHEEGVEDYESYQAYNILTNQFIESYNGDGTTKNYPVYLDDKDIIDYTVTPTITIDGTATTAFTVDATNKLIKFTTAPADEADVEITFTLKTSYLQKDVTRLKAGKYFEVYGSNGNMRLFVAGGGDAKYYYSDPYDATYFPDNNWEILGKGEDDIKGFGIQYNIMLVFKPREIYSVYSFTKTASMVTTDDQEEIGEEGFTSTLVNASIGCDCPNTIQIINNNLTWLNSNYGICTLISTSITDERNVRQLSKNINHTMDNIQSDIEIQGILDLTEDKETIQSIDFENKYFVVFPTSGYCYVWDYEISPFSYTSSKVTDEKTLSWFLFDKFYVSKFLIKDKTLLYLSAKTGFKKNIIELDKEFRDLDFNGDGSNDGIASWYMTPFLQFEAIEYLKNVKNIYVQCRGDTASVINMYYYTEQSLSPEEENEPIRIGGRIWTQFNWDNFQWLSVNHANTFARKCGLKKIQMCSFLFKNNDVDRDMSISHIGISYTVVKAVR